MQVFKDIGGPKRKEGRHGSRGRKRGTAQGSLGGKKGFWVVGWWEMETSLSFGHRTPETHPCAL